jgi:hypothetical protein
VGATTCSQQQKGLTEDENLLHKIFQTSFITPLSVYTIQLVRNYLLIYLKTTWYGWIKNNKLEDTN